MRSPPPVAFALLVIGGVALGLFSCGPKNSKAPPRPSGSITKGSVRIEGNVPFVVDWRPEDLAALETKMREGTALLRYNETELRLVPGCKTAGTYAFAATHSERALQLVTVDDIKKALPTRGASIAKRIESELPHGTTLNIGLVIVGRLTSSQSKVRRAEINGDCGKATHFVRRASVGAYVIRTGTKTSHTLRAGEVMAGRGEGVGNFLQGTGSVETCQYESNDRSQPPVSCRTIVQVEVDRLED